MTPILTTACEVGELEQLLLDRQLVSRGSVGVFVNISDDFNRADANFVNVQVFG